MYNITEDEAQKTNQLHKIFVKDYPEKFKEYTFTESTAKFTLALSNKQEGKSMFDR